MDKDAKTQKDSGKKKVFTCSDCGCKASHDGDKTGKGHICPDCGKRMIMIR